MPQVVELTKALIAAESVTPASGEVFDVLAQALAVIGFEIDRFTIGEAPDGPVENMIAFRPGRGKHLAFAGHLDVVPPGDGWTSEAFKPEVRDDWLYGRGAVDMKGAIAAFVAAAARVAKNDESPTLSFLITGDEEGPAIYGTRAILDRLAARGLKPDLCLVGEPTSTARLGDMIKIGRRGSVNIWIDVPGRQGHVAYPHLADNPIPKLVAALSAIGAIELDQGNHWFQPSNIEVTDVAVGNPASNVIPGKASARLSIRFNDEQRGEDLVALIERAARAHAPEAQVIARISGEAFLTEPGALSEMATDAIEKVAGIRPTLSTTGGTSDARFLSQLCPTVEFGLVNATMHKTDEAVALADLETLADIYAEIIARATIA
ncbi:succinyl-diaminopimelate desuccinylase [Sphingomonas sp.]|uniref:succinyl-diaminopimelate desuccinylase n=1 Tax=Sphingomonas sp. TaxID=28214 RepID=UPI002E359B20|nr:succinyl-diaminopimelate desuccinylase [Sphingomonas sp.]HEX4694789.1 succinyl-diaminopimelate desuccinylase [Sphingomonas sp.]